MNNDMQAIEVYIFSFNRGKFLLNCVNSAKRFIKNSIICILDDNSSDEETNTILDQLEKNGIQVLKPKTNENTRWGGFYSNINWVIQELAKSQWVILIEDDMQFIRPFRVEDFNNVNNFFDSNPKAGYIALEFLKEEFKENDKNNIIVDAKQKMYFFKEEAVSYRGTIHICSSGILNIKFMREIGYQFLGDRISLRKKASQLFTKKGFYPYPLLMYLPSPPTIKNKKTTITRRLIERYYKTGFYPYSELNQEELNNLLNRDISILPYTSDYLRTIDPKINIPYEYKDSMKRAHGIFRRIEKFEKWIRGL